MSTIPSGGHNFAGRVLYQSHLPIFVISKLFRYFPLMRFLLSRARLPSPIPLIGNAAKKKERPQSLERAVLVFVGLVPQLDAVTN